MPPAEPSPATGLLGSLELAVLRALWAGAPATVRTVLGRVNGGRAEELAYTSVMTVLDRLHDKELVTREPRGRAYEYSPVDPDEEALVSHLGQRQVHDLVDRLGDVALIHFVAALDNVDPRTMERLRALGQQDD